MTCKTSKPRHFARIRKHKKTRQEFDDYRLALGLIGEKVVVAVNSILFPKKKGYLIQHSNWLEYNYSTGTDIKVFDCEGRFLLDVECKNWRFFVRPYGEAIIESEIFDRFETSSARIKVLVISYLSLIPKYLVPKFKQLGITIIETSQLTTKATFYKVFNKLIQPLLQLKQQLLQPFKHKPLTTYYQQQTTPLKHDTNISIEEVLSNKQLLKTLYRDYRTDFDNLENSNSWLQ